MEENSTADKHPRRLVVTFNYSTAYLIKTDEGDRPQLVHHQGYIQPPFPLVQFATRLGLAKDKPVLQAVEKAYEFIARNYASGDQVILCIDSYGKWETNPNVKAFDVLARHLYDGTSPAKLANAHPGNRGNMTSSRIPIYGVVVCPPYTGIIQRMCTWSDRLKSRLPPGIQHIVSYSGGDFLSCSTAYDLDGEMISRELRFSRNSVSKLNNDATKHVLYYEQDWLPKWDKCQPVWTRVLNPSPHQAQGALALESMQPAGMHHHEVQMYQGLPQLWGNEILDMLVWKSCRKAPN